MREKKRKETKTSIEHELCQSRRTPKTTVVISIPNTETVTPITLEIIQSYDKFMETGCHESSASSHSMTYPLIVSRAGPGGGRGGRGRWVEVSGNQRWRWPCNAALKCPPHCAR